MSKNELEMLEDVSRGDAAKNLIESDLFRAAFAHMRDQIVQRWMDADARDIETKERCHNMIAMMGMFEAFFVECVNTGTEARLNLEWLDEQDRHAKRYGS